MGYLVEKYTEQYYLPEGEDGETLPYGVEGVETFREGKLREHDKEILDHLSFRDAHVLEFGFGRGESIKYAWEQGAKSYIGVDFSQAAYQIATDFLAQYNIKGPKIYCSDALDFIHCFASKRIEENKPMIDIVMMLDFIEHVPRTEISNLLELLLPCLADNAILVINTPDFLVDNDVILDGLDETGRDSSDLCAETQGMHCNRYTLNSLQIFLFERGYQAISRGHYFVPFIPDEDDRNIEISYRQRWELAKKRGCRLVGDWPRENFETAYPVEEKPALKKFTKGNLKDISIYITKSYEVVYKKGNYDESLTNYLSQFDMEGKTVLDIGAFVGVNTMLFARMVGSKGLVHSFEPNPFNRDRLLFNLSENPDLDERVLVYPIAISDKNSRKAFKIHRNVDAGISSASYIEGAHTTLPESELLGLGFTDISVEIRTIDKFVECQTSKPDFIKIDIEGVEHSALAGATRTLLTHQPIVLIELHSIVCAISVVNILTELRYKTELLFVEEDGRCMMGASPSSDVVDLTPASVDTMQTDVPDTKFVDSTATAHKNAAWIESLKYQSIELKNTLNVTESDLAMLRTAKEKEIVVLNRKLIDQEQRFNEQVDAAKKEIASLHQIINNQENFINTIISSLEKYQTFPIIRLGRLGLKFWHKLYKG